MRDPKGVHRRVGRNFESDGGAHGNLEKVDRSDLFFGVDEEPFPLQGNDLDRLSRFIRCDRSIRIQLIGFHIRHDGDDDRQNGRDAPPEVFCDAVIDQIGIVFGVFILGASNLLNINSIIGVHNKELQTAIFLAQELAENISICGKYR